MKKSLWIINPNFEIKFGLRLACCHLRGKDSFSAISCNNGLLYYFSASSRALSRGREAASPLAPGHYQIATTPVCDPISVPHPGP
jgi:hypothetical protein